MGAEGGEWKSDSGTKKISLFLADETTKIFEAGGDFADSYDSATKTFAGLAIGDLVKYTVDKKDKVTAVDVVGGSNETAAVSATFDKNGVYNSKALKDSTVVFNYGGTNKPEEKAKAGNYSVMKVADLYEQKDVSAFVRAEDGATTYAAILAIRFNAADTVYTFFVKDGGTVKGGHLYTALYDGEVKDMTVLSSATQPDLFTTSGAANYKLTFDGDDISKAEAAGLTHKYYDGTKKGSVAGNVYTYDKDVYSMDPDAVVYVKDGSDWSVEKLSYLGKNIEYFSDILLFKDSADDLYDIVIVVVR